VAAGEDAFAAEVAPFAEGARVVAAVTLGSRSLAAALAARLQVPATLVLAHGLTSRDGLLSWGAVDEEGSCVVDYFAVAGMRLDEGELRAARERALPKLLDNRSHCREAPLADHLPAERVVLVQRGLNQGLVMDAAVSFALRHGAEEVVVATPWSTVRAAAPVAARERVSFACPHVTSAPPPEAARGAATQIAGW
jgi:predicted phosphoribosyltransferase